MYQEKLHVSFDELIFKKFSFFTPGRKKKYQQNCFVVAVYGSMNAFI